MRLCNVVTGLFSLGVKKVEIANPEALLEVEKENFRKQIGNFNAGLSSHAGLCERLMTQVKNLEKQEAELRSRTAANLKAGNAAVAGQCAMRLASVKQDLEENRGQLTAAEKTYQDLVKSRNVAQKTAADKIEQLSRNITDMKIKKATAEMMSQASGMITQIGGSGDTMERLTSMVNEQREKAAGQARVAQDSIDMGDINIKEAEQTALANQALAEFAAKEGIEMPKTPLVDAIIESQSAPRSMGAGA